MIGLLHRQLLTKHRLRRGGCVAVSADLATLPTPGPESMRGSAALCDRLPFLAEPPSPFSSNNSPSTKIKDRIRRVTLYRVEERRVVLADIMVSCALQKARAN